MITMTVVERKCTSCCWHDLFAYEESYQSSLPYARVSQSVMQHGQIAYL